MQTYCNWFIALAVTVLITALMPGQQNGSTPIITVSKETTYFTEPLLPDGSLDFVVAWDRHCKRGVTPQNNAALHLARAFGTGEGDDKLPDAFFREIGCEPPRESKDQCYIHPWTYFKDQGDDSFNATIKDGVYQRTLHPWSRNEFRNVAAWLDRVQTPLSHITQAAQQKRCYLPLQKPTFEKYRCLTLYDHAYGYEMLMLDTTFFRRAMMYLKEKKWQQAMEDILVMHRMARWHQRGEDLSLINDFSTACTAIRADCILFAQHDIPSELLSEYRQELERLAPLSRLSDNLMLAGRCRTLDSIVMTAKHGESFPGSIGGPADRDFIQENQSVKLTTVDWDEALRLTNQWFDRVDKDVKTTIEQQGLDAYRKLVGALESDREAVRKKLDIAAQLSAREQGKLVAEIMQQRLLVNLPMCINAEQRYLMFLRFRTIAVALEQYRHKQGVYPDKLAQLVPGCLAELPKDISTNAPPSYQKTEKGYRLYSFALNGVDDQGRSYLDEPRGDDIVLELPTK